MIDDIKRETNQRMGKSLEALTHAFGRIRTGRANPRNPRRDPSAVLRRRYAAQSGRLDQRRGRAHAADHAMGQENGIGNREGDSEERPRYHAGIERRLDPHSVAAAVGGEPTRPGAAGKTGSGTGARRRFATSVATRSATCATSSRRRKCPKTMRAAREEDIQRLTDKRISEIDHALSEKEVRFIKDLTLRSRH